MVGDPVRGEHDQCRTPRVRTAPVSRSVSSTASTRGRPRIAVTAVRVPQGHPVAQRRAEPGTRRASGAEGSSVTITDGARRHRGSGSATRRSSRARRRRRARGGRRAQAVQVDELLEHPGRHHAGRTRPGTSRADRGLSRQPVASRTAGAAHRLAPGRAGDIQRALVVHPVTMASVTTTRPGAPRPARRSGGRSAGRPWLAAGRAGRSPGGGRGAGCLRLRLALQHEHLPHAPARAARRRPPARPAPRRRRPRRERPGSRRGVFAGPAGPAAAATCAARGVGRCSCWNAKPEAGGIPRHAHHPGSARGTFGAS